jgi:hypothetical protein
MRLIMTGCKLDVDLQRPAAFQEKLNCLDSVLGKAWGCMQVKFYSGVEFSLPLWVS